MALIGRKFPVADTWAFEGELYGGTLDKYVLFVLFIFVSRYFILLDAAVHGSYFLNFLLGLLTAGV